MGLHESPMERHLWEVKILEDCGEVLYLLLGNLGRAGLYIFDVVRGVFFFSVNLRPELVSVLQYQNDGCHTGLRGLFWPDLVLTTVNGTWQKNAPPFPPSETSDATISMRGSWWSAVALF